MFAKIDVNGDDAHPLYVWLKHKKSGALGANIKWNFTKFLIGRDGRVIKRFGPTKEPAKLRPRSSRPWRTATSTRARPARRGRRQDLQTASVSPSHARV